MKKIGKKGWIAIGVVAVIIIFAIVKCTGGKKEEKISFDTARCRRPISRPASLLLELSSLLPA